MYAKTGKIRIAARQSDLARLQAHEVGRALQTAEPGLEIEYSFRSSLGDQRADDPLWKMPEKGVFTEDFVADILSGKVDLVVHSWKDLPIGKRQGTEIAATLPRADARDVLLVRRDRWKKVWLSARADSVFRILTSSPRRVYNLGPFLKWALPWPEREGLSAPQIEFVPVRGNIATRVKKLVDADFDSSCDGLVVAKAALDRLLESSKYGDSFVQGEAELRRAMALVDFIVLPLTANPTAAAQGALAIEVRSDRCDLLALCAKVDAKSDRVCVEAERRELAKHGGGCHQKIGVTVLSRAYGRIEFIRGLTDAGQVLNSVTLTSGSEPAWPRANSVAEIFSGAMKSVRRESLRRDLPPGSYFVARANAWPEGAVRSERAFVWTAGLETWSKLAARGIWVNGTNESLGEIEPIQIEKLAGGKVNWLRLTHEAAQDVSAAGGSSREMQTCATYRVQVVPPTVEDLQNCRYFYWKSGSQFRAALALCPEIRNGYHGSGLGHTQTAVRAGLAAAGLSADNVDARVCPFLNESDFLRAVTGQRGSVVGPAHEEVDEESDGSV